MLKKYVTIIIISIVLIPSITYAFNINIGTSTWFNWWQPFWQKKINAESGEKFTYTIQPSFLYGPVLNLGLTKRWRISSMLLLGNYSAKGKGYMIWGTTANPVIPPTYFNTKIKRYDSDTTIGFSLTSYFRIFLGFKYMKYNYKNTGYLIFNNSPFLRYEKKGFDEYGPGLGFVFSMKVIDNFYLIINSSVIYAFGIENNMSLIEGAINLNMNNKQKIGRLGSNNQLSFMYLFEDINVSASLGFRYQMLKLVMNSRYSKLYSSNYDHIYGITALVMYNFNFDEKKNEKNK